MGRNLIYKIGKIVLDFLVSIFCVILIVFAILKFLPGRPSLFEGPGHSLVEKNITENEFMKNFFSDFFNYMVSLGRGDLGQSMFQTNRSVIEIILNSYQQTWSLYLTSVVFILILAFLMSWLSVKRMNSYFAKAVQFFVVLSAATPSLFLAPLCLFLFAYQRDWLPAHGLNNFRSYILPIFLISFRPLFHLTSLLTQFWSQELHADYVLYAKAKGLSENKILLKHALKNSINPVLNYLGPMIVHILSGSFLVEILFLIPGAGTTLVQAISERDYSVILGMTLVTSVFLIFILRMIDFLSGLIDPRRASL